MRLKRPPLEIVHLSEVTSYKMKFGRFLLLESALFFVRVKLLRIVWVNGWMHYCSVESLRSYGQILPGGQIDAWYWWAWNYFVSATTKNNGIRSIFRFMASILSMVVFVFIVLLTFWTLDGKRLVEYYGHDYYYRITIVLCLLFSTQSIDLRV